MMVYSYRSRSLKKKFFSLTQALYITYIYSNRKLTVRSFTDYSAKKGKKYYYTVKARFDNCGCPIYSKYNSKGWSITYNP